MRFGLKSAIVGIAAFAVLAASGGAAFAKLSDLVDPDEIKAAAKCVATIQKSAAKYTAAHMKLVIKCKAAIVAGKTAAPLSSCNPLTGDLAAKDAGNFGKLGSGIAGKCCGKDKACGTGSGDDADIPLGNINWDIGTCPELQGQGGTVVIADAGDIADCIGPQARFANHKVANSVGADVLDSSLFGAAVDPGKSANKCQATAFKSLTKFYLAKSKIIGKCWAAKAKLKGDDFDDAIQCPDTDMIKNKTSPAIEKTEKKLAAALCKKCGGFKENADGNKDGFCDADPGFTALGFLAKKFRCPNVTVPGSTTTHFYDDDAIDSNGVDCSKMGDPFVDTIQEYINCTTCIAEYQADCMAAMGNGTDAGLGMNYPTECVGVPCGNGQLDGAEVCDPGLPSPQCPGGNGNQDCHPVDCDCKCPALVTFEPDPNDASSVLDTGFSGFAHGSSVIGLGTVTVALSGGDEGAAGLRDPTCGVMDIGGPLQNPEAGAGQIDVIRCSISSDVPCDADSDCPAAETCETYFGSRLPLSAGGVSACVTNRFTGPIVGTADIETGDSANSVSISAEVVVGPAVDKPCDNCIGDVVANDGSLDGTCDTGSNAGGSCDVGGVSPVPAFNGGVPAGGTVNGTSLDCPQAPAGSNVGVLPINLSNSTGVESLTVSASGPGCTAFGFGGSTCICDTCATAAAEPCNSDANCPGAIVGSCGGLRCTSGGSFGAACTMGGSIFDPACHAHCTGPGAPEACCTGLGTGIACSPCSTPGEPTKPNPCLSGMCTAGACTDVSNGYCGPTEGFRGCAVDSDCTFAGDTCTFLDQPCFDDNGVVGGIIAASGAPDVPVNDDSRPTLASTFCVAPVAAAAINTATGLPGAGRVTLTGDAVGQP